MDSSHVAGEQEESFLNNNEVEQARPGQRKDDRLYHLHLGILLLSIVIHAIIFSMWINFGNSFKTNSPSLYSPFQRVLSTKVEIKMDSKWDDSVYMGPPSKDLDNAWHKLQEVIGISLSPDEAAKINLTDSIRTKKGDYMVEAGFVHNIHCLRYLYEILHRDIYKHALNAVHGDPKIIGLEHAYHCIEALRDSTVCRPDLNLYGVKWSDEQKSNLVLGTKVYRECVNYDSIWDVALSRKVTPIMIADAEDSFLASTFKASGG